MSEQLLDRDADDDPRKEIGAGSPPRWVGPLAIVAAVLFIVALVVLHLTGAVGPGAH